MSDGRLYIGRSTWSGGAGTGTSGEFRDLFKKPFRPSDPGRHRQSQLAREFPHLAGKGERAARPPRRVPNTRGMLGAGRRLIGPYGWLLDLPGLIEDLQTTGEWMYDEWMTLPPGPFAEFHSNFQQRLNCPTPSTAVCPGTLAARYATRPHTYILPTVCTPCQNHSWIHATFNDAANSTGGNDIGEYVTYAPRRSVGIAPVTRVWLRTGLGPSTPNLTVPRQDDFPQSEPEPLVKEYPKKPRKEPKLKPWERPARVFRPGDPPGGEPDIHEELPPGDKEEVKKKMDMGITGKIYGELTEFRDMMDCFAEASGMKKPKGTIGKRARAIYEHLNATNRDGTPKNPINTYAFAKCMALANAKDFRDRQA